MAAYIFGSSLSYSDYLQAKEFLREGSGARRSVSMEVSRHTRSIIASQEALARDHIHIQREAARERIEAQRAQLEVQRESVLVQNEINQTLQDGFEILIDVQRDNVAAQREINQTLQDGFETISYELADISSEISELNATFHWGFSEMIGQLGHMNDTLSALLTIAKTPVQNMAFNHFEIARDAFRQGLYAETLEELEKAIAGDHTSSGYKLEWRFHHLRGLVRLGFVDCDTKLLDLAAAEEAFLAAARYAQKDYPEDAGRAFLSAGWAAYCQGKMPEALAHTEHAMKSHPGLTEALFQASKVHMAMGDPQKALPMLGQAIESDPFFALKAAGDGDFQKHEEALQQFLEALRQENFRQMADRATVIVKQLTGYRFGKEGMALKARVEEFMESGSSWPLMDMLQLRTAFEKTLFLKIKDVSDHEVTDEVIKMEREYHTGRIEIHEITPLGGGKPTASFEFILITAGEFMMGDLLDQHRVRIKRDFLLGRYPVTQAQWMDVMGSNPSHFRGADLPVENVSWQDTQAFLSKLNSLAGDEGFRLPSEAEWEYACRSGSRGDYCFGDDAAKLGDYAWYEANSNGQTHQVGLKKPSPWGLHDMHGNVWEWVQDWYHEYTGAEDDGSAWEFPGQYRERIARGGSWCAYDANARAAWRHCRNPDDRNNFVGLRVARTL